MHEHLRLHGNGELFISMPLAGSEGMFQSLSTVLAGGISDVACLPLATLPANVGQHALESDDGCAELVAATPPGIPPALEDSPSVFFRLAPHGASTLVRLPAASSHRLRSTSIIATIHDAIPPSSSENPTVCAKPRRLDQQGDVHCIVDRLLQSTGALREQTCSWGSAGYGYFIQGCLAHASVQLATSALVSCRA